MPTTQHRWMQLYPSGLAFDPMDPDPELIRIEDIAHALGMTCRYGGHVRHFYSVAEHCVLVSQWLERQGYASWIVRQGLMHDAAEAYMADLIRPIKHHVQGYREAEDRLLETIFHKFNLPYHPLARMVQSADLRIVVDEREELLKPPPMAWSALEGVDPLGVMVTGWQPAIATEMFLERFKELW